MRSAAVFGKYMKNILLEFHVFTMYFCSPFKIDASLFSAKKREQFACDLLSYICYPYKTLGKNAGVSPCC